MGVWHTSPDNRAHALRQVDAVSGRDCPYARYRLKYPPPTSATRMAIMSQIQRGLRFQQLHTAEAIFLMPNAWDVGSALMLASCGFPAIATTSAGVAFSLGFPDQEAAVSRETMLDRVGSIAAASPLPVSADLQSGYGASPEEVGETIAAAIRAGVVGANIEDYSGNPAQALFDREHAVARVRAARRAADASGVPFVLTAVTLAVLAKRARAAIRLGGMCAAAGKVMPMPRTSSSRRSARINAGPLTMTGPERN